MQENVKFNVISGIKESVCEVIGSQYLTKNGWNELRNPSDTSVPFRLFRDDDSTFLQVKQFEHEEK